MASMGKKLTQYVALHYTEAFNRRNSLENFVWSSLYKNYQFALVALGDG